MTGQTPRYGIPYPELTDAADMGPQIEDTALNIDTALSTLGSGVDAAIAGSLEWEDVSWSPEISSFTKGNAVISSAARRLANTGLVWITLSITAPASGPTVHFDTNAVPTVNLPIPSLGPSLDLGYYNPATGGAYSMVSFMTYPDSPTIAYIHAVPFLPTAPKTAYFDDPATIMAVGSGIWAPQASLRVSLYYWASLTAIA